MFPSFSLVLCNLYCSNEYLQEAIRKGARVLFGPSVASTGYEPLSSSLNSIGAVAEHLRLVGVQLVRWMQVMLGDAGTETATTTAPQVQAKQ